MTPEDYKILKENCELWDKYSPSLLSLHGSKFTFPDVTPNIEGEIIENGKGCEQFNRYVIGNGIKNELSGVILSNNGTTTIENTSNASSHIGLLKEEIEEWCGYCSQPIKKHAEV